MKADLRAIFRLRPVLVGLALFSFMWVVVSEVNYSREYYQGSSRIYSTYGSQPPDHDKMFLSFLLVIASLALLIKNIWSHTIAVALGGLLFYGFLFSSLWRNAENAELPIFSAANIQLWWQNLSDSEGLQIILAGFIFCYSSLSLIILIRRRKNPTMSNN